MKTSDEWIEQQIKEFEAEIGKQMTDVGNDVMNAMC